MAKYKQLNWLKNNYKSINNECIEWIFLIKNKTPLLTYKSKYYSARRLAYLFSIGKSIENIKENFIIINTCGNNKCISSTHAYCRSINERFFNSKQDIISTYKSDNCFLWKGRTDEGIPIIVLNKIEIKIKRFVWELINNKKIDINTKVIQKCGNKLCYSSSCITGEINNSIPKNCYNWLLENHNGNVNDCIFWPFNIHPSGYPVITKNGKRGRAHRMSLELKLGRPIKEGYFACHSCDNPSCVNSNHLFEGTTQENTADMISKNRQCQGSKNASVKLTEKQVLEIRYRYTNEKISKSELGKIYEVSSTTINKIIRRKTWKHI